MDKYAVTNYRGEKVIFMTKETKIIITVSIAAIVFILTSLLLN